MKYATEQRLRLIDFLLAIYGHVNREAVIDYFDVGEATATRDFTAYRDLAPGNLVYNASDRKYYKTESFARVWQ